MRLPYDMGNAGDLLKHGVLAEFVRWRCESGRPGRFFDLFGGEPERPAVAEVARRVRALPDGALRAAQKGIDRGRYYGSSLVALHAAGIAAHGGICVLTADRCLDRLGRLRKAGLSMLDEKFPRCGVRSGQYDAWTAFAEITPNLNEDDLVLLDPFGDFLRAKVRSVVPQMEEAAKRGAVLLFALNLDPGNSKGQQFDALLGKHLPGAWRMTCPPLHGETGVRGESKYYADVVLAARPLREGDGSRNIRRLRKRLAHFTRHLAGVLGLHAETLGPRDVPSRRLRI